MQVSVADLVYLWEKGLITEKELRDNLIQRGVRLGRKETTE